MNKNNLMSVFITFVVTTLIFSFSEIEKDVFGQKDIKEKSPLKDYFENFQKQNKFNTSPENKAGYKLLEIFYIPEDEPLDKEDAKKAYCYLSAVVEQEEDLEAVMRLGALAERVGNEFGKKELNKYYETDFCDGIEKILDQDKQ